MTDDDDYPFDHKLAATPATRWQLWQAIQSVRKLAMEVHIYHLALHASDNVEREAASVAIKKTGEALDALAANLVGDTSDQPS